MYMKEYNSKDAVNFIYNKIVSNSDTNLTGDQIRKFLEDCALEEENYMSEAGFFDQEENDEELIYDEEDAFNYILSKLRTKQPYNSWKEDMLEDLIDDYIEFNYDYMVSIGLVD